jgi:predicted ATP-binding protein involved in virulence
MRITRLALHDYRGFAHLDLEFAPGVTALVGVNGAGKTSILDAVAVLLSCLQEGIRSENIAGFGHQDSDVRSGAPMTATTLSAVLLGGDQATWTRTHRLPFHPREQPPHSDLSSLAGQVHSARSLLAMGKPFLPLAVYFPTNRAALDIPARIRTPHVFDALSAYDGALDGGANNFRGFFEWFREEEDVYNEQLVASSQGSPLQASEHHEDPPSALPAVRRAIEQLLPGAKGLRIERRPQRMTVEMNGVRLDVGQLSDGEKCLLAMVGDLARRMALAAPGTEDPLRHPAVVLIDEVELHLHPGMQRLILPRLQAVFPCAQFIVTTHSPQVLSSLRADCVRILEGFALRPLSRGTWRRDTNLILEAAFGDPGRPPDVARKLREMRDAVDEDRFDDARRLIAELSEMIEGEDPEVFYYQQLLPPEAVTEAAS